MNDRKRYEEIIKLINSNQLDEAEMILKNFQNKRDETYLTNLLSLGYAYINNDNDKGVFYLEQVGIFSTFYNEYLNRLMAILYFYERRENNDLAKKYCQKAINYAVEKNLDDYIDIINLHKYTNNFITKEQFENYINQILKNRCKQESKRFLNVSIGDGCLYQYQRFTKDTLYRIKNELLYFTNPTNFNDPMDPLIKIPVSNYKQCSEFFLDLRFRIACLTTHFKNTLMWSHYGDKHKGICIKYDIRALIKKGKERYLLLPIDYVNKLTLDSSGINFKEHKNILNRSLLNYFFLKNISWQYENEYRILTRAKTAEENPIKQEVAIKNIYIGKDMSDEHIELIRHVTSCPLYKMKLGQENIFDMEYDPL